MGTISDIVYLFGHCKKYFISYIEDTNFTGYHNKNDNVIKYDFHYECYLIIISDENKSTIKIECEPDASNNKNKKSKFTVEKEDFKKFKNSEKINVKLYKIRKLFNQQLKIKDCKTDEIRKENFINDLRMKTNLNQTGENEE